MIIGGGVFQVPAIKIAKSMGLKVVVTDYNPESEGMLLADYPIEVSTRNINLTVNTAKQFHMACPLDEGREALNSMELPLVIKPCDNMSARGVRKIEQPDDLIPAFREAKEASIEL